jgi:hypothetical protein
LFFVNVKNKCAMLSEPYYPVGIQDFSEIRRLNALYVDKTELIYRLTAAVSMFFSAALAASASRC